MPFIDRTPENSVTRSLRETDSTLFVALKIVHLVHVLVFKLSIVTVNQNTSTLSAPSNTKERRLNLNIKILGLSFLSFPITDFCPIQDCTVFGDQALKYDLSNGFLRYLSIYHFFSSTKIRYFITTKSVYRW
jgi:hypothetical protein